MNAGCSARVPDNYMGGSGGADPIYERGCTKMKKIVALILALAMVLAATAALATSSPDTTTKTTVTTTTSSSNGGTTTVTAPLMWRVATTDAANELITALNAAKEAGDISTAFPEDLAVDAKLVVADVISVEVAPEIADETSYTAEMINVAGVAKDAAARTLALVDTAWFEGTTKTPADNTVDITFQADTLKAMAGASNITLIVLVEAAE